MAKRKRKHAAQRRRRVNGNPDHKKAQPPTATEPLLEPGDMGIVRRVLVHQERTGALPTSPEMREAVGELFYDVMTNAAMDVKDRLRAAEGMVVVEKVNMAARELQQTHGERTPPTITVVNDPEYVKWKHQEARKRLEERTE